jgi:pimeloyl-ACP methyl ester carboxylesterase
MVSEPLLSHDRVAAPGASPGRWLPFLHGVFGAGRNWGSIARRLVRARPEWGALLVDLRLHGGSRAATPPHTIGAAAADVHRLVETLGVTVPAILGHSFGGKVALEYARGHGAHLEQVWVIDSTPAAGPPGGSAWRMLEALRRVPSVFPTREAAMRAIEAEGFETGVAQWVSTNLEPADGGYRWRLDLDGIEALLQDFFRTDLWAVLEDPPGAMHIHVVKAIESSVLPEEACARIEESGRRTGRVHLHRLAGGHWLNADNPDGVLDLLVRSL